MSFIKAFEEAYRCEFQVLSTKCCPETIEKKRPQIARATRLIMMVEALNRVEGPRDRSDDDLLPAMYARRDSTLLEIATFDLQARLPLLEPGLYLGLPYLPHCHTNLLPLYLLNCSGSDIAFAGRKVLAVAAADDDTCFTGTSERTAQQIAGATHVPIGKGEMSVIDDYDIYVDGDCLEYWFGTLIVNGETKKYHAYARGLMLKRIVRLEEG